MKNVVIVAAGAACPIGLSLGQIFDSLAKAEAAINPITRFPVSRLRTGKGGSVELSPVIEELGQSKVKVPFWAEDLELCQNPKLAFALSACAQALTGKAALSGEYPSWCKDVKLFTTAGLEEVSVDALWRGISKENHICPEIPPTFIGEVLSSVFSMTEHPPVSVVSACASSTQSIGEAARSIDSGQVELALAGGTDSMLFPFGINAFNSLSALAEGHGDECKLAPFDEGRAGTLLGEGAAYVLLAKREKARELGLAELCEVVGYSSSLDGYHPVKPHPQGAGAELAVRHVLQESGIAAQEVDYINAHGSGTFHNDLVEAAVIKRVFAGCENEVPVSSTKPYYGHLLTAGGAIELLSLLFAFKFQQLPPTLNLSKQDERCPLDVVPNKARKHKVDVALSNSFGLHGQNGVLLLRAVKNG